MFENSSKGYQQAKQEELNGKLTTTKAASTSTRQWSAMRNPRIVRMSQTLGGKDRHSKVCTIRGLRDRRIRLSVPTAIQLYDLQHKLGLSQPSKVVDWLLDVTKSDIDKLPPLDHFFSHHFHNYQQQTLLPPQPGTSFSLGGFFDGGNHHQNLMAKSVDSLARLKGKEADHIEKGKWWWTKTNEEESQSAHHKLFSNSNDAMTYNSSYNIMEPPSSLSLSQFGSHGNSHHHNPSNGSAMQFPSSSSQLLFRPSSSATSSSSSSSLFTQHVPFMSNSMESDPRQCNNHIHQFLSSISTTTSQLMPHAFIPPIGRHPRTPFSSKLLDSNHMGSDQS